MLDDLRRHAQPLELQADICVIGAGAAGISVAREFVRGTRSVILLESGGIHHEPETQALYDSDVVGLRHLGIHQGRARVYGGSTTWWAGQALPLDPIDFEPRPWVAHSGWPLRRDDLEPYYRRAERVMNVPASSYDERCWPPEVASPAFDRGALEPVISQFSPVPDFARAWGKELEQSQAVRVLLHANVTELRLDEAGAAVESVTIRSLSGETGRVKARYFVLCCGGIETPRLLLASNKQAPRGIGNDRDLVGRFFQDHLHVKAGVVRLPDRRRIRDLFDPFYRSGLKHHAKLRASPRLLREERLLNVLADVFYETPEDSAVEGAKLLVKALRRRDLRPRVPQALANVAKHPLELADAAYRYFVKKRGVSWARGPVFLGLQLEPQPNEHSRVYLTDRLDPLGVPRVALDWRLTDLERRTIEVFVKVVAREFARLGLGHVDPFVPDDSKGDPLGVVFHDANHHMGTTRMADSPEHGVVDAHCRVHGVKNLFIGSSSVFPTSGFSNPTLTIIALCLRIADELKRRLNSL